jgi:hypothetical protein
VRASSTRKLLRVAKHIRNALKEIERAKKSAPTNDSKLMRQLQVLEAYDLLRVAYGDLGFLIGMTIASIHSDHRTNFEKLFRAAYPNKFLNGVEEKFSAMPVRRSQLDYSLAAALNSLLDTCRTSLGTAMRPVVRHRIISCVFLAALKEKYDEGTVRTAISRTSESQ